MCSARPLLRISTRHAPPTGRRDEGPSAAAPLPNARRTPCGETSTQLRLRKGGGSGRSAGPSAQLLNDVLPSHRLMRDQPLAPRPRGMPSSIPLMRPRARRRPPTRSPHPSIQGPRAIPELIHDITAAPPFPPHAFAHQLLSQFGDPPRRPLPTPSVRQGGRRVSPEALTEWRRSCEGTIGPNQQPSSAQFRAEIGSPVCPRALAPPFGDSPHAAARSASARIEQLSNPQRDESHRTILPLSARSARRRRPGESRFVPNPPRAGR